MSLTLVYLYERAALQLTRPYNTRLWVAGISQVTWNTKLVTFIESHYIANKVYVTMPQAGFDRWGEKWQLCLNIVVALPPKPPRLDHSPSYFFVYVNLYLKFIIDIISSDYGKSVFTQQKNNFQCKLIGYQN